MPLVQSARPRPQLAPFVRAYAQRTVGSTESPWTEIVPAQLEQMINLELGVLPAIRHGDRDVSQRMLVGGAQTGYSGSLGLRAGVESFAIFFWPTGWSQLFNVPVREQQTASTMPFSFTGPLSESCGIEWAKRILFNDALTWSKNS
jgi:hypothetical protein